MAASTNRDLIGMKKKLEDRSPSSWVVQNRRHLYVDSIDKNDQFQKRFHHYEGAAFLLAPIISGKKVIGIISITDKIGEDSFTIEERKVFLDITSQIISLIENQKLIELLKKKRRTLQKKNLELQKLEQVRTDLFNMLIHDMKGPISDLMANLDILSYTLRDDNLEFVESARRGCDTLYNMVCNLLDIVRLEEGRLEPLRERIDPEGLIKEASARIFSLFTMKGVELVERHQVAPATGRFWGDRGILLRVLENFLTNAINYSPENESVEMGFSYPCAGEIEFFVRDKGPGIPSNYREKIFDKYVQLDKKGDGRIYTTGLGLAFCKLAVEAHGGKIGVESCESGGSRFFFRLALDFK